MLIVSIFVGLYQFWQSKDAVIRALCCFLSIQEALGRGARISRFVDLLRMAVGRLSVVSLS